MATVQSRNTKLEISVSDSFVQLCATDQSLDFNIEIDDITDMCDSQWRNSVSEIRQLNVSVNGVFDTSNTALTKIKSRFSASASETESSISCGWGQCAAKYTDAGGSTYTGLFQINSYSESSSFNQEVRFSFDGQFSGSVTIA